MKLLYAVDAAARARIVATLASALADESDVAFAVLYGSLSSNTVSWPGGTAVVDRDLVLRKVAPEIVVRVLHEHLGDFAGFRAAVLGST